MSSAGLLSLLIVTRNRPDALERCLRVVADGHRRPDQVVVIDQSTDDRTRDVVARAPMDVNYRHQAEPGLGRGQNLGFSACAGAVVAVTDDDCVPAEDWIEVVAATFAGRPDLGAVTGRVIPLPPAGDEVYPVASRTSTVAREFRRGALPWDVGSGNNFAVRAEWLARIGGCDERLGPGAPGQGAVDIDLFHRLLRQGALIRYEPGSLVLHQRQTWKGRRARRFPYGHGMGAASVLWRAQGDRDAWRLLARWLRARLWRLAAGVRHADRARVVEECLVVAGTLRGIGFAASLALAARRGR